MNLPSLFSLTMEKNKKYFLMYGSYAKELLDIKEDLNSNKLNLVKDAIRKIIAQMTLGNDCSSLYTDVIKNIVTEDLELKKLIYLYIINYSIKNKESAILIVNTLVNDCISQKNSLLKGIALRTLTSIRLKSILEYSLIPIKNSLVDIDPYVKKIGIMSLLKIYLIDKELLKEIEYISILHHMLLTESNSFIIGNVCIVVKEIGIDKIITKDYQLIINNLMKCLQSANE